MEAGYGLRPMTAQAQASTLPFRSTRKKDHMRESRETDANIAFVDDPSMAKSQVRTEESRLVRRFAIALDVLVAGRGCSLPVQSLSILANTRTSHGRSGAGSLEAISTRLPKRSMAMSCSARNSALFRFDGVRSILWRSPAGQPLPGNNIDNLVAARDGTL